MKSFRLHSVNREFEYVTFRRIKVHVEPEREFQEVVPSDTSDILLDIPAVRAGLGSPVLFAVNDTCAYNLFRVYRQRVVERLVSQNCNS